VVLMLAALGIAIFGTTRLTRSLEPRQRAISWVVLILAIAWLIRALLQMGVLGRVTGSGS